MSVDPARNCPGSLVSAASSSSSSPLPTHADLFLRLHWYRLSPCSLTHTHTLINLVKGEECREESSGNTRDTLPPSVRALMLPPKAPLFRGTLDIEGFRLVVSRGRANAHRAETAPSWGIIIVGQAVLLTAVNGDAVCNWGGLIGFCLYVGSR